MKRIIETGCLHLHGQIKRSVNLDTTYLHREMTAGRKAPDTDGIRFAAGTDKNDRSDSLCEQYASEGRSESIPARPLHRKFL